MTTLAYSRSRHRGLLHCPAHVFRALGLLATALLAGSVRAQQAQPVPAVAPAAPAPPATLAELQQRLSNHVNQSKFDAAVWGVKIVSLDSGATWFEHNPQKLLSPASNAKLFTVALALDRLGPDYRIRTSLYSRAAPNSAGTLAGDLVLYGRGDPTFNTRLHGSIHIALEPLVSALTNAGVRKIAGDLIADDSFFRGPQYGSGWSWDDAEYYYGAELSALTINDNLAQVSIKPGDTPSAPCRLAIVPPTPHVVLSNRTATVAAGGARAIRVHRPAGANVVYVSGTMPVDDTGYLEDLTVHRPSYLFAGWLCEVLARHGVEVAGQVRVSGWLEDPEPRAVEGWIELAHVDSPPLRDIAREVQKPSQNLYTDLLLAHIGETRRRPRGGVTGNSEDLGIAELNRFLGELGLRKGEVIYEEGSGLSRNNLNTANATVRLLEHMSRHSAANPWLQALPIAGVDGTLRRRMKDTPAMNNVRAKTGTLRWANSLSGYVTTKAGERLAFALMLNRYYNQDPAITTREELDTIAVLLAGFGQPASQ